MDDGYAVVSIHIALGGLAEVHRSLAVRNGAGLCIGLSSRPEAGSTSAVVEEWKQQ